MKRRTFLNRASIAGVSLFSLTDPFIDYISTVFNENEEDYLSLFSHICDLYREDDFVHFRFYFVNLELKNNRLIRSKSYPKKTNKSKANQPAYMLVRIPQQHIAETYVTKTELENKLPLQQAFISGYSYLTFELKSAYDSICYSPEELLDWDKFNLITLDDLNNRKELKAVSFKNYPNDILSNRDAGFFFSAGNTKIPVTLFEVPFKLFLSPHYHFPHIQKGTYNDGYKFIHPKNKVVEYYQFNEKIKRDKTSLDNSLRIVEPWQNTLKYKLTTSSEVKLVSPDFKAIAFQEDDNRLLPNARNRKDIVNNTLFDFDTLLRNIHSKDFKIGAMGITTYLHYQNLNTIKDSNFVEWKHDIKNGRDNYVEVVNIGIDIRSGKKVLVSQIGRRLIHKGKSVWVYRNRLNFLETEKNYTSKDFPYTDSNLVKNGFYFKPAFIENNKTNPIVQDTIIPKDINSLPSFIAVTEDSENQKLSDSRVNLIEPEFIKTDRIGNKKRIKSHIAIVFKTAFNNQTKFDEILIQYKKILSGNAKTKLREEIYGEKIAFIEVTPDDKKEKKKNTSLTTEYFQYECKKKDTFSSNNPLSFHLLYAKVVPPQIEGFSNTKPTHFTYTAQYKTDLSEEYDKNKVFFKSISDKIEEDFTKEIIKPIENIFTENLKNIGNIVKPDINIEGISELDQAITLAEDTFIETKTDIDNALKDIKSLRPKDILRGLNSEIFNGISIKEILKELIPIDQSPVFEVLEKAEEGLELIGEIKKNYIDLKNIIKALPEEIERLGKELFEKKKTEVELYFEKFAELEKQKYELLIKQKMRLPFREESLENIKKEIEIVKNQIPNEVLVFLDPEKRDKDITQRLKRIVNRIGFEQYISLCKEYLDETNREVIDALNEIFYEEKARYNEELNDIKNSYEYQSIEELYTDYKKVETQFNLYLNGIKEEINNYKRQGEKTRKAIEKEIKKLKTDFRNAEKNLKNFAKSQLRIYEEKLKNENKKLIAAYNESEAKVKRIEAKIRETKSIIKKILESNQKTFTYKWNIEQGSFVNFKNSFIGFQKNNKTALDVNVKTDINYELSLERPPKYIGTETYSKNQISSFSLSFFDALTIDFDRIVFESGTKIDTDLDVRINDVYFSGALNFINAFEEFMSVLNFLKEIAKGGITVEYDFPLPNISGGAFNFINAKIHAGVFLPIGSEKSMRFDFGLNSPNDMFLVSYGIFGGRGCFQIGITPKKGVVKILLVIEFGGVVLVNVGVAKGFVYLFAGIYFHKENNNIDIKGYLVAGGHLSIAGLISASVTFLMSLRGDGQVIYGKCAIRYTVKISRFFKKTFTMTMEKKIAGANKKVNKNNDASNGVNGIMKDSSKENVRKFEDICSKRVNKLSKKEWKKYLCSFAKKK